MAHAESNAAVEPILEVAGVTRRFGDRVAVDDISFSIPPGQIYGLLGPNGAGKTTTMKMVCGLLHPDSGTVRVAGHPAGSLSAKALVGYVPQDIALYPDLTGRENLRFLGRLFGLGGDLLGERVDEALELTDLGDRANDRLSTYSGGMQRRLNIAAGLLNHPVLLVLDEPTVGVDPQSRHAILERVQTFGQLGMAVVYTTHYMEEAERVCDRVGIVDRGRLVAEGTRRELVDRLGERDRIELGAAGNLEHLAEACRSLEGVEGAAVADHHVQLLVREGRQLLPAVLEAAERTGVQVSSVDVIEPDLEAVFLHLTGTALRE
ncbi:MAG TPA: ABC transporter ATP-binding protein [Acidimicrobiales bacterium]|jgi:ABC-2 type transport system ATP-binding protein|nr:ABC transporter ATP-binding protein [Acidimicrobiales bacterium]